MYFVGSLITIFVTSVEQLMISFSILQGKLTEKIDKFLITKPFK